MTPGSAGTASDGFRVPVQEGRHRAPPTVPTPKALPLLAVAAAVLTVASLVAIAGTAVAPDARAAGVRGTEVATTARAQREVAGPLVLPSIGAEGAWTPPEETRPAVRPVSVVKVPVRTQRPASTTQARSEALVATTTPSVQTVTPTTPAVTPTETPTAPTVTAAATTASSATTEEQPVTEIVTVEPTTVDVTTEVVVP